MLKWWIKYIIAFILYYSGMIKVYALMKGYFMKSEVVMLGYHRILDLEDNGFDYSQRGLVTSVANFRKQMEYLQHRFSFVSLHDLVLGKNGQKRLPSKAYMVSLDGWKDSHDHAFPILQSKKVPAAIFLTTDFIGTRKVFWHTKLAYILLNGNLAHLNPESLDHGIFPENLIAYLIRLRALHRPATVDEIDCPIEAIKFLDHEKINQIIEELSKVMKVSLSGLADRRFLLNWDEVKEMSKSSIEFGSHSCTHRILPVLSAAEAEIEITQSKRAIEKHIQSPVETFACPNGDCNSKILQMIMDAGYKVALFRFNDQDIMNFGRFTFRRTCIHDGMSTNPWGKFSKCLFDFELTGIRHMLG